MVQGLAFLSKKGFNPTNQSNRKQVWEAQQASKLEEERLAKRQQQLERERQDEELAMLRHGATASSKVQLGFMYQAPPGLAKEKDDESSQSMASKSSTLQKEKDANSTPDITKIQANDDPAAAAFRKLWASQQSDVGQGGSNDGNVGDSHKDSGFAPVLQGSTYDPLLEAQAKGSQHAQNDTRSALEKAVGRRDGVGGASLTLAEQVARFPQLQNAPMAKGMSSTNVNVKFQPLGAQLRNVKCMACGRWGHSRGDRECEQSGWDPFKKMSTSSIVRSREEGDMVVLGDTKGKTEVGAASTKSRHDSASDSESDDDSSRSRDRKSRKKKKSKKRHRSESKRSSKKHKRRRRSESPSRRRRKDDRSSKKSRRDES